MQTPWEQRFLRERASRKEAERLLEEKSLQLYEANLSLEEKVKQRTLELEAALLEAQAAQRAKDAFLSSMSHELRTPLNAIIGFAQILSKESALPERVSLFVEKIYIAGNNLLRLINSVLDYSKLEAQQMQISPKELDIELFLQERLLLVEPQMKEKQLQLTLHVEKIALFADEQL